jgi:tetratricopeptide (TPR) repeat protein/DNA-binding response OmpR family regulator
VLKQIGFEHTVGVADLKSAVEVLEMEPIDWIITPVFFEDPVNGFQLLKLILDKDELRGVYVTFLTKENNTTHLTSAFAMGLFSYMPEKTTKSDIEVIYSALMERLVSNGWNITKTSASFLRELIPAKEILKLNRSLLQVFPGDKDLMCHLSESYFLDQNIPAGKKIIQQVLLIDPELKIRTENILSRYVKDTNQSTPATDEASNPLSLKHCVIIDPDPSLSKQIEGIFVGLGIPKISIFSSAEEAFEFLKKEKEISFIITECALKPYPGFILVQKLKKISHLSVTPILATNSELEEQDRFILQELGILGFLKKPFSDRDALEKIIWAIQQIALPSEPLTMEFAIRDALGRGEIETAKGLLVRLLQNPHIEPVQKLRLEAEILYHDNKFDISRDRCLNALKFGETSVFVLNLLGKILLKTKDFEGARRCLDLAYSQSPLHMERLCQLSDCKMVLGDLQGAENLLAEAKTLDANHPRVLETEAKKSLLDGNVHLAKEIMTQVGCFKEVVAFMNNRAVTLSLENKIEESISLYKEALQALPKEREDLLVLILYNLALANAREGNLKESFDVIKRAFQLSTAKNNPKLISLYQRLKKTIENGGSFQLQTSKTEMKAPSITEPSQEDLYQYISRIALKPGELACHKIYVILEFPRAIVEAIQKTIPFHFRKAIGKQKKE